MMKKPIHSAWYSFSILFIMLNLVSCKKNVEIPNDAQETYTIGFRFQEFEQHVAPFGPKRAKSSAKATTQTADPTAYEGSIYFWSFNAETLMPDLYPSTHSNITYNDGQAPHEYGPGWVYGEYDSGRSLSLKGVKDLIFEMPLTNISAVHELSFDVSSSGTGPKGFSLLFSQNGVDYTMIKENNQFANTNTPHSKNSFSFSLGELSLDFSKKLYIKLISKAGLRGSASDYNEVSGIFRLDNFRLAGIAQAVSDASVRRVHYHIFDAVTQDLVLSGADHFREGSLADFALEIPAGDYIASFVTNVSNEELNIPEIGHASTYFIANPFSNSKAEIFGVLDTFSVSGDMQKDIELTRYYSEIRFAFTDSEDLSEVAKLVVKQEQEPNFYAPFLPTMGSPVEDLSEIILYPQFDASTREVFFHQFIGNTPLPVLLRYTLEVYNAADELLRTFQVESEIRNNIRLLFRGKLLDVTNGQFVVRLNEHWNGDKQVDFN